MDFVQGAQKGRSLCFAGTVALSMAFFFIARRSRIHPDAHLLQSQVPAFGGQLRNADFVFR